jgi:glycine/D-amino acid oxidase-like deaminating enzyme
VAALVTCAAPRARGHRPPNAGPDQRSAGGTGARAAQAASIAQNDPDVSNRWMNQDRIDGSRRFVQARFPLLADMPLNETRACHYESSINRDFIIDHLPDASNAWVAGVGQAEGFKFGPVVGEYVARASWVCGRSRWSRPSSSPRSTRSPPTRGTTSGSRAAGRSDRRGPARALFRA